MEDDNFVYDAAKADWPGIGVNYIEFRTKPKDVDSDCAGKSSPGCIGAFLVTQIGLSRLQQANATKNVQDIKQYFADYFTDLQVNFENKGLLLVGKSVPAQMYEIKFYIFDEADNLVLLDSLDLYKNLAAATGSKNYKITQQVARTFQFIKM